MQSKQAKMEDYYLYCFILILTTFCILIFNLFFSAKKNSPLPPGPSPLPIIGNLLLLRKPAQFESILRQFKTKYGPIISLRFGSRHSVYIGNHSLAYKALVQNGVVFSDRPVSTPPARITNSNQHNISSAAYGPTWRTLRRNLNSEILHPSRVKSYSDGRKWVLGVLFRRFLHDGDSAHKVIDHFRHAMFCLLCLMCFGDKLPDQQIHEIESMLHRFLISFSRFQLLGIFPRLGKLLFRRRWQELLELRREQERVLIPPIRARIEAKRLEQADSDKNSKNSVVVAFVDTLVDLQLPEDKRNPDEGELVTMCSEFLNAGTDTTSTALQWIIANLVKNPGIQEKLYEEIVHVVGPSLALNINSEISEKDMRVVEEEDLVKMPYLKAIVLEGLRRHPPGHFVLPHSVTEDVELDGYVVPKRSVVNFLVAEMGLDPDVWEDPMEFKPERFLAAGVGDEEKEKKTQMFDITCSKEIKMMPFGAGRRMCPAANLAMLHLEYFVANLIWYFEWKQVDGQEVDLSEKQEFTTVMKNPLSAHISPRVKFL